MAMFNWSGTYINPQDVAVVHTNRGADPVYPFYMTVHLRDGKEYSRKYKTEDARDADAAMLANQVNPQQLDPVSRSEVKGLLDNLKGALRRDIKALRDEIVKES